MLMLPSRVRFLLNAAKLQMIDPNQLMNGVRNRNVAAFEAIYDSHQRLVYSIALRMLHDSSAAEDIAQTVFLKLWTRPESFRGGDIDAWLARLARNRSIDVLRTRRLHPEEEMPVDLECDFDVERLVLGKLDAERTRAALMLLPQRQRVALELAFFDGMTAEQIARKTFTPLGTIKTRVRDGLRKLRSSLATC